MPSLLSHAKNELKLLGYIPLDEEQEDGPNKWIQENILELINVFSNQGHSGSSASYCIGMFFKLASFEPITPLTGSEDEWVKIDFQTWQNIRCSRVFRQLLSNTKSGQDIYEYYDMQGKVFEEPDGARYTSRDSRVNISFPYVPKTEIVYRDKDE